MGGVLDYRIYDYDDRSRIASDFRDKCEQAKLEDGISYPGTIAAMDEVSNWQDMKFSSQQEAADYLSDNHSKWSNAMVVSFYLAATKDEDHKKRIADAQQYLKNQERAAAYAMKVFQDKFKKRTSRFVACRTCESKLSKDHISRRLHPGSVSDFFVSFPGLPECPLCKTFLLSKTDTDKVNGWYKKVNEARQALEEARKPTPSKKVGWLVGGWCSS